MITFVPNPRTGSPEPLETCWIIEGAGRVKARRQTDDREVTGLMVLQGRAEQAFAELCGQRHEGDGLRIHACWITHFANCPNAAQHRRTAHANGKEGSCVDRKEVMPMRET